MVVKNVLQITKQPVNAGIVSPSSAGSCLLWPWPALAIAKSFSKDKPGIFSEGTLIYK
jgi:hypothetical protein